MEILVGRRMNLMEYDEIQEDMSEDRVVSNEKGIHSLTVLACMDVFRNNDFYCIEKRCGLIDKKDLQIKSRITQQCNSVLTNRGRYG